MTSHEWPIGVRMVDLREPLRPIVNVEAYPRVRVFVSDGPSLIGSVEIRNGRRPISTARLRDAIGDGLTWPLAARAIARGLQPAGAAGALPPDVSVSVVVPTCDRAEDLRRCLTSLFTQRVSRRLEIVVVDNRPGRNDVRQVCKHFPGIVAVEEHRPGLSYARNAGFAAASGDILVATDDDVVAPPDWIEKLVAPFARADVLAVTGHILPLELETEAQCRFEAYGGLGKGFERFEADGDWFRAHRTAVPTWTLGATANAAFRASALANPAIGLLEESLGAGTPTGCSEDSYLFYKILKAGYSIVYEPSAYVWHRHRRTRRHLHSQIYAYSKGHVAYHLTTLFQDRDPRALVRLGWSLPKAYLRRALERVRGRSEYPLSLIAVEILGNLAGPWSLWKSRYRVRLMGRSAPLGRRGSREPARTSQPVADPGADAAPPSESSHAVPLESPVPENPAR